MIRATLDANVLASGFAGADLALSVPGQLIRDWRAGVFALVTSDHLLTELRNTLRQPYFRRRLSRAQQSRALATVRFRSAQTPLTVSVAGVATHPEDDLILAAAVSAQVNYLVTGDAKLLRLGAYAGVQIVTPRRFLEILQMHEEPDAP